MDEKQMVDFLLNASKTDLQDAMLKRLAEVSEKRKELSDLLNEWVEQAAEARLINWFLLHGEELAAKLGAPASLVGKDLLALPSHPFALPQRASLRRESKSWRKRA